MKKRLQKKQLLFYTAHSLSFEIKTETEIMSHVDNISFYLSKIEK
jgi:hypothetical protein